MNRTRNAPSTPLVAALVAALLLGPALPAAAAGPARLEGLVAGVDGRPAAGFRVHAIDARDGRSTSAEVAADGSYSLRELAAGRYALAIETPSGELGPVRAPAVEIGAGELARRDLKLLESDPGAVSAPFDAESDFGRWWAGMGRGGKAWAIAAVVVVGLITADALSSDEKSASTFN